MEPNSPSRVGWSEEQADPVSCMFVDLISPRWGTVKNSLLAGSHKNSEVKSNKTVPHIGKNSFNDDPRSYLSKRGTIDDAQGTKGDTSNPENPSCQQVPSMNHRQFTVPVPLDLNVGVQDHLSHPDTLD